MISKEDILSYVPQQVPFRFIDQIVAVDDDKIEGCYTFREDEVFYQGHFPGNPVTPGVILLETMAQTGVVAFGLYLVAKEKGLEELSQWVTLFSDAKVEFSRQVKPGEKVIIRATKKRWRRMKLMVDCEMMNSQGELVCHAEISGMGVKKQ